MLKIAFNTVLGVILILIWLRFVNLNQIIATISTVDPKLFLPVFIFMFLSPAIRALRLKVLLGQVKQIKWLDLTLLNGAAMMLNFFIPIRVGELAKGVYLHSRYDLGLGKSIIWVFIDRFVDFLAVLGIAALLVWLIPTKLNSSFFVTLAAVFLIGLIITYLIVYQTNLFKKLVKFLRHILIINQLKIYFDRLSSFLLESFSILKRSPRDLASIIFLTILAYGADAFIWYFIFLSLKTPVTFLSMYLGQVLSALTYLIPAAPGYVGSAEASGLVVLSGALGMGANIASAMIVLFHILSALFIIIFGLISIFSLKIEVGEILRKAFKRN